MTVPAWIWAASAAALITAVVAEIALTGRPTHGSFTTRQALGWIAVYVSLAVLVGLGIGVTASWVTAGQFYAAYLTEYSLSLDNLFIFFVIMGWFAVPPARQPRVLLLGIGLALVMRSILIVAGAAALNRFGWLFYPLGGILVWTAFRLITAARVPDAQPKRHARLTSWLRRRLQLAGTDRRPAGQERDRPVARRSGRGAAAPVLLLALALGLADLLFAFDSIPAVFGITTSAALVVACSAFALMGLRQLYALVAGMLDRIVYLNAGLGVICAFIGVKLLLHALHGSGAVWTAEIPAWLSVIVVAIVLLTTVTAGMIDRIRPLSAEQRAVLERRFAVIDTDGNGVWQRNDHQLLTRRLCETFGHAAGSGAGQAAGEAQRSLFDALLAYMDANDDQAITRDEFVAALGRTMRDRPAFDTAVRTAARTLIQVADQDGNEVLDAGEYARLAAVYGARSEEAERSFDRLDQDRNGVLDAVELTLAIGQFFTSRDPGARGSVAFGHL
jgi:tellurite resistance protein TerC